LLGFFVSRGASVVFCLLSILSLFFAREAVTQVKVVFCFKFLVFFLFFVFQASFGFSMVMRF